MKEFDETIFNLFIIWFWKDYYYKSIPSFTDEYTYDFVTQLDSFKMLKDCFPIGENCNEEVFHCGDKCYYNTYNFIKEV